MHQFIDMKFHFYSGHFELLAGRWIWFVLNFEYEGYLLYFSLSTSNQSLISQLFPINFSSSTHSTNCQPNENLLNRSISLRPIASKVLSRNILSTTNDNLAQMSQSNTQQPLFNEDLQASFAQSYVIRSKNKRTKTWSSF